MVNNDDRFTDQDSFNSTIGELDHVLSRLVGWAREPEWIGRVNEQTLKHHAEDMELAGKCILEKIAAYRAKVDGKSDSSQDGCSAVPALPVGQLLERLLKLEEVRHEATSANLRDIYSRLGRLLPVDDGDGCDPEAGRADPPSRGVGLIFAERVRQMEAEGFDHEYDDSENTYGQLARAAACYATPAEMRLIYNDGNPFNWPWNREWWKPSVGDRKRELAKAGALIAAELDRLLRVEAESD